jgi:coenzyme F420 hydrogenase subunit beta
MTNSLEKLAEIIEQGLCHRCGACSGACPAGVIEPDKDYYPVWGGRDAQCTDCGLCVKVCPGIGFSFPDHARRLFGRPVTVGEDHGIFLKAFIGYAMDPAVRERGTSGGLATQIPMHLLLKGRVRGALVVGADRERPWRPRAIIARSREELLEGSLSKYPACSVNQLFKEIRDDPGPFVFTGLPCHVHGLRKMMDLDRALGEKIAVSVGLFCHSCLDHQLIRDIFQIYSIDEKEIVRVEYRGGKLPGYIRALLKSGRWVYLPYPHLGPEHYRPNAKECLTFFFKFYSPPRCRLCIDATSEFADIAVGDPWFKGWEAEEKLRGGYSLIVARTRRGLRILEEARDEGAIALEPFPEERAGTSHAPMVSAKRMRAFYNIQRRLRHGLPVPDYGFEKLFSSWGRVRAAIHRGTYFFADRPRTRRAIFRLMLSRAGRFLVGALFFRRRIVQALWEKKKAGRATKGGSRDK